MNKFFTFSTKVSAPTTAKNIVKELVYIGQTGALYITGESTAVSNWLAMERNRKTDYCSRGYPVVLLHGLAHNQSWAAKVSRSLKETGFSVRAVNYATIGPSLDSAADAAAEHIIQTAYEAGVDKVHVAAHSLGGLVLRIAASRNIELDQMLVSGITVGSPHSGTPLANSLLTYLPVVGELAVNLQPGSEVLRKLSLTWGNPNTKWVSIYSKEDELVPGLSGKMFNHNIDITNIELQGLGHAGLIYNGLGVTTIVNSLIDADDLAIERSVERWVKEYSHKQSKTTPVIKSARPKKLSNTGLTAHAY